MLIDHTTSFVAPDLVELRSTEGQLRGQSGNPLAFPSRSALDQLRSRVASMRSALTEADAAMSVERDQAHTLSALMDAYEDMATMFDRFGHSDLVGAIAMCSSLDTKLQTIDQLAHSPSSGSPTYGGCSRAISSPPNGMTARRLRRWMQKINSETRHPTT
jgi:hypothetical protein